MVCFFLVCALSREIFVSVGTRLLVSSAMPERLPTPGVGAWLYDWSMSLAEPGHSDAFKGCWGPDEDDFWRNFLEVSF